MDERYSYLAVETRPPIVWTEVEVLGFEGRDCGDVVASAEETHGIKGARWLRAVCVGGLSEGILYKPVVGGQLGLGTGFVVFANVRVPRCRLR